MAETTKTSDPRLIRVGNGPPKEVAGYRFDPMFEFWTKETCPPRFKIVETRWVPEETNGKLIMIKYRYCAEKKLADSLIEQQGGVIEASRPSKRAVLALKRIRELK